MYTCERCGYECKHKYVLVNHLKRKKPCECTLSTVSICDLIAVLTTSDEEKKYVCKVCGKKYANRQSKYVHQRTCNNVPSSTSLEDTVAILQDEIRQLKSNLPYGNVTNINITNMNNITNNTNNTQNIIMNDFGNEDISHVTNDVVFVDDCLNKLPIGIRSIIEKIYYDEDHPENKTILMRNRKLNQVMVRDDGTWMLRHVSETIPKMIKKGRKILHNHYIANESLKTNAEDEPDPKLMYFNELLLPQSIAHKNAVAMVKTAIGNHKYEENQHG